MFKKLLSFIVTILLVVSTQMAQPNPIDKQLVSIDSYQSFDEVHQGSQLKFAIKVNVEENWHINSDKPNEEYLIASKVNISTDEDFAIETVKYPEAKEYNFGFSDKPVSVFEGNFLIGGIIKVGNKVELGTHEIPVKLTFQACNNVTCMPPKTVIDTLKVDVVDNTVQISEQNSEIFSKLDLTYISQVPEKDDSDSLASTLESSGLLISLILVFLGGLALNLTPCVYPLIPITIGYFGGQSEGRTSKLFVLGLLYVLGMSVTYSIIGVVTSLSGSVFGTLMQNPIVIIFVALVFVILSLSMFGVYEFKMPDSWVAKAGGAKSGALGALFMGLTMGVVAAPCIGPFVLGLVTYVAAKGDPFYGFLMFFFLAIGLGTPYLFLALFSGKIKNLPRAGFWMEAIKHIFGFILLGMALYFLGPLIPKGINHYILPIYGLIVASYLLIFDKNANDIKGFRIFKIVFSIAILAVSAYALVPKERNSLDWQEFSIAKYENALQNNQKMVIDFYADWCIPCKELEAITFSNPEVISASKNFVAFKVDMTQTMSDKTEKIRNKFNIVGMPTILIIDSNGKEVERLTGFIEADEFKNTLSNVN